MAKHDQRILKFLNQNADRAPTITEMMTRLNISISDISDSLAALQAQGLIAKKTNAQGIECWFPASAAAAMMHAAPAVPTPPAPERMAVQNPMFQAATAQMPAMGQPMAQGRQTAEVRSPFMSGAAERPMPAPEPQPPLPRAMASSEREARPVQVQHVAVAEAPRSPEPAEPPREELPGIPRPSVPAGAAPFPAGAPLYGLAPASRGIGILTLLAGLVAAVALSAFIATRLVAKEMGKASAAFVDRKALADANAAMADFQEKTKAQVAALEGEIKKLTEQVAASKAAADSLRTVAASAAAEAKAAPAKAAPAGKSGKAAPKAESKAAKGRKAGADLSPTRRGKPPAQSAAAKAAARGAAMRKKSPPPAEPEASDGAGSWQESLDRAAAAGSESPSVPNPPGLDDLPPPPAE